MTTETTAAPSTPSGDISISEAVSLVEAAPKSEQQSEQTQKTKEQENEPSTAEESAPETDSDESADEGTEESAESTDDENEQEGEASDEEQPAAPAVKPPASWTKDAQEAFAKLPQDLQEVVAAREKERESFANTKAQEAAQARKERDQLAEFAMEEVTKTLRMAQDAIEGEFAGIDWTRLQYEDPAAFMQLDAARKMRLERIQGLQQHRDQLRQQQEQTERAQALATLLEEVKNVKPVLQEMMGKDYDEKTYAPTISKYLADSGVPQERIGNMQHGWELTIATKAMLYDKMQAAKAQATKKIASAPVMQKSGGKPLAADSGRAQKHKAAMARLEKTGSIDDAVAALRLAGGSRS